MDDPPGPSRNNSHANANANANPQAWRNTGIISHPSFRPRPGGNTIDIDSDEDREARAERGDLPEVFADVYFPPFPRLSRAEARRTRVLDLDIPQRPEQRRRALPSASRSNRSQSPQRRTGNSHLNVPRAALESPPQRARPQRPPSPHRNIPNPALESRQVPPLVAPPPPPAPGFRQLPRRSEAEIQREALDPRTIAAEREIRRRVQEAERRENERSRLAREREEERARIRREERARRYLPADYNHDDYLVDIEYDGDPNPFGFGEEAQIAWAERQHQGRPLGGRELLRRLEEAEGDLDSSDSDEGWEGPDFAQQNVQDRANRLAEEPRVENRQEAGNRAQRPFRPFRYRAMADGEGFIPGGWPGGANMENWMNGPYGNAFRAAQQRAAQDMPDGGAGARQRPNGIGDRLGGAFAGHWRGLFGRAGGGPGMMPHEFDAREVVFPFRAHHGPTVEETWANINFTPRKNPIPGYTFDFDKEEIDVIMLDDDDGEKLAMMDKKLSLVCCNCMAPLRVSQGQRSEKDRVIALSCGHLIDQRCLDELCKPKEEEGKPILEGVIVDTSPPGAESLALDISGPSVRTRGIAPVVDLASSPAGPSSAGYLAPPPRIPAGIQFPPRRVTRSAQALSPSASTDDTGLAFDPDARSGVEQQGNSVAAAGVPLPNTSNNKRKRAPPMVKKKGGRGRKIQEHVWHCPVTTCARPHTSREMGGVWAPKKDEVVTLFV